MALSRDDVRVAVIHLIVILAAGVALGIIGYILGEHGITFVGWD